MPSPWPSHRPSPRLLVPAVAALLLLGATGCGQKSPSGTAPTSTASGTGSDTASASVSDTAAGTPTPSKTQTPTATPTHTTAPKPGGVLLPAGELPGFNQKWRWSVQSTGAEHGPLGICQRLPMQTIGADKTVVRHFVPAGNLTGGTGAQLVSTFVDDKSASQAIAILDAWHRRCGERLNAYGHKTVGPATTVPTAKGTATRYLVSYTKKGATEGTFDDLGVLRSGSTVELLRLTLHGLDYTDPDPMTKALQNAADRLP